MKTKICPRCGSEDVEWIIPQNWSMWSCSNCDYTGAIIEVDNTVKEKIQERWHNHKDEILHKTRDKSLKHEKIEELSDEELEEKLDELFE